MKSKLVRVLEHAGRPLTAREAYELQWEILTPYWDMVDGEWVRNEQSKTQHDVPTYSYGIFTGNICKEANRPNSPVSRTKNDKGLWVYSLKERRLV